jgi:hypothetical protein
MATVRIRSVVALENGGKMKKKSFFFFFFLKTGFFGAGENLSRRINRL